MISYIIRRLCLILPTLLGIMLINFTLVQFVPGGPIEQIIAGLESDASVFDNMAGGAGEIRDISKAESYLGSKGFCLLYTSPSPRDLSTSRMPSSA